MMSVYALTILTVSATVSPFDTDDEFASEKPSTFPPSDIIADVNESLVLVDGSKKRVPSICPEHAVEYARGCSIMSFAISIRSSISLTERSRMSIRFLIIQLVSLNFW